MFSVAVLLVTYRHISSHTQLSSCRDTQLHIWSGAEFRCSASTELIVGAASIATAAAQQYCPCKRAGLNVHASSRAHINTRMGFVYLLKQGRGAADSCIACNVHTVPKTVRQSVQSSGIEGLVKVDLEGILHVHSPVASCGNCKGTNSCLLLCLLLNHCLPQDNSRGTNFGLQHSYQVCSMLCCSIDNITCTCCEIPTL